MENSRYQYLDFDPKRCAGAKVSGSDEEKGSHLHIYCVSQPTLHLDRSVLARVSRKAASKMAPRKAASKAAAPAQSETAPHQEARAQKAPAAAGSAAVPAAGPQVAVAEAGVTALSITAIPTAQDFISGTVVSPAEWARSDVPKVRALLQAFVSKHKLLPPAQASLALHDVPPLKIVESLKAGIRNSREVWNFENCKTSIDLSGMYQASGSLFWLNAEDTQPMPGIPTSSVTWSQLASATEAWAPEALRASHSDLGWQRFEFHGVFATCISTPLSGTSKVTYQSLPLLRGVVLVPASRSIVSTTGRLLSG